MLIFSRYRGPISSLGSPAFPGVEHSVEGSTNSVNWLALSNQVAEPDGSFQFIDTPQQIFRAGFIR